ncbi:MAG: PLP-dependent aminotransferase family protein [Limnobacter sp.]|nr:PLP-dependent aminotransferase family protein [Limnobacter sp.]
MLLYEHLADDFSSLIANGQIRPGERLPSVRHLAQQRNLSVSTVLQALRTLESKGLIEARPQSGFYVRGRGMRLVQGSSHDEVKPAVEVGLSGNLMKVLHQNESAGMAPFGSAIPAPQLLLAPKLNTLYSRIARTQPKLLAKSSHGHVNEDKLVRALMRRYLEWGTHLHSDEIIITNSCTEAMMLCLRAVTREGDTVAVESPTYYLMLQLLEAMGLKALEIPTHPSTGISVAALELATRNNAVAACLLIPNGSNPLGCVASDDNKRAIAKLLAQRNIPLIEDDLYGDICHSKQSNTSANNSANGHPRPIYSFDESGNTMLCSSFSKTVSPGLRLGFVAGGKRAADVLFQKTVNSGNTNAITQNVLAELIESRGFDLHLRSLRRKLSDQIARTRDAVERHFPTETRITDPQGGFVLWIELPEGINTMNTHALAVKEKIAFVPGALFSPSGNYSNFLRLACGHPWSPQLDDAVKRLGAIVGKQ